jgi:adenosylcobinamide amidohydrolase/ABC-type Fe3+-hydroxamate transport system substrate-binding protein
VIEKIKRKTGAAPSLALILFLLAALPSILRAATFTDDLGRTLNASQAPSRVASLAPGASETLCSLEIGSALKGITTEDSYFECLAGVPAVGPKDAPDWKRVLDLEPDLIVVETGNYEKALSALEGKKIPLLAWSDTLLPEESEDRILRLAAFFHKEKEGREAVAESRDFLETIKLKVEKIPPGERRRVLRLRDLGDGRVGTPGKDSYETVMIRSAGGIPFETEGDGLKPLSGDEFARFDPQFVYGCQKDRAAVDRLKKTSPWSRNEALKNIHYYPCALTNLTSAHTGYFTAWLSADLYFDLYGDPENFVRDSSIVKTTPIPLPGIPYVKEARVVEYHLFDFPHRTLLIDFVSPQNVISSGDGAWNAVSTVGNSGSPPMTWSIRHRDGWEKAQDALFAALKLERSRSSILFTGADLRALSVQSRTYRDLRVTALVTAGVDGNALRTSKDTGGWYQGTINIILLSNRALSPGGAASAAIVATEAKTAALWDMDVRSAQTPRENPATGTGTDDVIVVTGGNGAPLDYTGGHSKIGELIASAVYDGVVEALRKQNGKAPVRPAWLRIAERGILLEDLGPDFSGKGKMPDFKNGFLALLLDPRARALVETAFALDDAKTMGELSSLDPFEAALANEASLIAGKKVEAVRNLVENPSVPPALRSALNALGTALLVKNGF